VAATEYFVDAGQTAVRIRALGAGQDTTLSLPAIDTSAAIAPQIARAVCDFTRETRLEPWRITISSTGLSHPIATANDVLRELRHLETTTVILTHDAIGGYLAALGNEWGAVAAIGTGIVTLGVGRAGVARVDGWGNIIGDAGSGFWIGRLALESALRAHDGRGPRTALLDMVTAEFPNVEEAYLELQADPARVVRIAALARTVIEMSADDAVAADIVTTACAEIALSLEAALRRAGFETSDSPLVGLTGNITKNADMTRVISEHVWSRWPAARIVKPTGEPLDGVALIPHIATDHPLFEHIFTASAA
jgi:N-acetylglucosamine kinase-like BadF-type ATPase